MNILVTYCWVRSSYAVMRNLVKYGHKVFVADAQRIGMCQWSFKKAGFDRYTSHYIDEDQFIEDVINICIKRKIDVIIPSHNETAVFSKYIDRISIYAKVICPSSEHCDVFNNKKQSFDLAERIGLNIPKRINYSSIEDLREKLAKDTAQGYFVKLLTGNSSKGVFACSSKSLVLECVEKLISEYRLSSERLPQVEHEVKGDGWGCSVLYWHGELICYFTHKRLIEKISDGGTSTLREAAQCSLIEDATKKLFDHVGFHGFAMAEYKYCEKTKTYWFIEVNPRLWGSIPLAIDSGVEFPRYAIDCLRSGPVATDDIRVNIGWSNSWLLGTLFVLFRQLLGFKLEGVRSSFKALKADAFDDLYFDDPFVFFGEVFAYIGSVVSDMNFNPVKKGMLG